MAQCNKEVTPLTAFCDLGFFMQQNVLSMRKKVTEKYENFM